MVKYLLVGMAMWTLGGVAHAQDTQSPPTGADRVQDTPADASAQQAGQAAAPSPLTELGSEFQNSIELLRNRFRIDYEVDEITMVFFREYGSAPVVLVRPDGSKLFQSQAEENGIFWYDADTFDMVSIKEPVAGPWQAVGRILPESRVMVLSDLALHAEPLPTILFSGEILKSTAHLTNDGNPIDYNQFRDVVELTIEMTSTNNPDFDNFGANDELIATFEDNGRGMDEAPLDGTFTGQFNLSVPAGEWTPIFTVTTPMFSRQQINEPIRLYANPVELDVELDGGGDGYHKLLIDVDRELVDIETLLVDGKVRFPNGDMQTFSLTEPSTAAREHLIVAYEEGVFRVKLTAFGTTSEGREFILDVPEYTFLAEAPEPEVVDPMLSDTAATPSAPDEPVSEPAIVTAQPETAPVKDEMDTGKLMTLLLAVNGTILGLGVVVAVFIMLRRRQRGTPAPAMEADAPPSSSAKPGILAKLTGLFKKRPPADTH